ncbi:hypothetical protein [Pseudomonas sp. PGPR40]|uniref:hypothetical protein n=1 Tax=Pseudomonas sp. PGPR40 TaxID=2913476 RepID=UPI001EDABF1D|nr:hypothetical protein [Pseudomonas sp. PGPR40]
MDKPIFDIYLANGNITVFCGTHADKLKSDILNSSLYAELVATRQTNDPETSWLTYTDVLSKFNWVINSRDRQRKEFDNTSLLQLIIQSAGNALPTYERQALDNAFSRIKKLGSDSLVIHTIIDKLKTNATFTTGSSHALLNIVRKDKTLLTLQISFETAKGLDISILDEPVLMSVNNGKTNIRMLRSSLDELRYNDVRDTVIQKLGNKINTELLHIPVCSALN